MLETLNLGGKITFISCREINTMDYDDYFSEMSKPNLTKNVSESNISGRILFHNDELKENSLSGQLVTIFTLFDVVMIFAILAAVSWIQDDKIDYERHPVFLPIRPPRGFRLYAVLVETGQSPAGGTTSKVYLRMCGRMTKSAGFTLVCTSRQRKHGGRRLFGSQNKDIFILSVPHYLGNIEAFEVMTDRRGDSPPWFLRSIRVMCLDNRKCWKSDVGAWLRGDMKPYSIKASLIGALSTREYFIKVMLQNHNWTFAWYRSLGSSFTCSQRSAIHWTSMGVALGLSHYLLYDEGILDNVRSKNLITPAFTANDIAQAAFASGAAGVLVGSIMRFIIKLIAGGTKWARVDDRDDFSHIMEEGVLEYAQGAVVKQAQGSEFEDCLGQLKLTPNQIRVIKHITECGISECSLRAQIDDPVCKPEYECCYSKDLTGMQRQYTTTPASILHRSKHKNSDSSSTADSSISLQLLGRKDEDVPEPAAEPYYGSNESMDSIDAENDRMEATKRGFRHEVEDELQTMLSKIDEKESKREPNPEVQHIVNKLWKNGSVPRPSRGPIKTRKIKRITFAQDMPSVSARVSNSEVGLTNEAASQKASGVEAAEEETESIPFYDSLSDEESDQELATKGQRTESEINLTRRSAAIYDAAPRWHDQHRVYVQAPTGALEHHQVVNGRYDFADSMGVCCLREGKSGMLDAIEQYKIEENQAPPGDVILPDGTIASGVAGIAALIGVAATGYTGYQRYFLSNADSLIYLYAVLSVLALHLVVFSTVDAVFWALASTWARRTRILDKRANNANW